MIPEERLQEMLDDAEEEIHFSPDGDRARDVMELLVEVRQLRSRAESAEQELSEFKAQWYGNFDRDLDGAEPVQLKIRCPECWAEAQTRVFPGGASSAEEVYELLIKEEWCVKQEKEAAQRSLDGWLAANPKGKKW